MRLGWPVRQPDHAPVGTPSPASRNPGIDVLRGLAIVLVVLNHIGLRIPLARTPLSDFLPERLLVALNYNGYEAVVVFFVISGFLITGNALRRSRTLHDIRLGAFYWRRFTRIVPCLLLLIAVLSALHAMGFADYVIHRRGQSLGGAVFSALALHLNWYEGRTGYLPGNWDVLWSLSIEELFYLGFPLFCLLTRRAVVMVPVLLILALSMPWTHGMLQDNPIWREKAYLPGMAAIAAGVLGALLAARWSPPLRSARLLGWLGVVGLLAVLLAGSALWQSVGEGYLLVLVASTLCLLLASHVRGQAGLTAHLPGTGWLQSWGRLSYEIYLSHMFVVYAGVRLFRALGSDVAWGLAWYALMLPLCWLLGLGVARWISLPAERWLRGHPLPARVLSRGWVRRPEAD